MSSRDTAPVQYVSYWETAAGQTMPPWIALALVSFQRALGARFTLLTPHDLEARIDPRVVDKAWGFHPLAFTLDAGIEAIVAKSDLIRMAYVHRHGGVWLDADTLLLRDPTADVFPDGISDKLHWHSECLFASRAGNPLLEEALAAALEGGAHAWGNPGGIKDIVARRADEVVPLSAQLIDPGYRPRYNFDGCEVMRRKDVAVADFLLADISLLKLYNTYFKRTSTRTESVAQFLDGGSLLARLFLHIEPDRHYWLAETARLTGDQP
ncbi:glycosyltransferase [Pseudomonas sp. 5P_5.1_Bac1]|uniref:glycosyltransferase n=1 Tax=Pseudomonas sp. 5P_5.1_Bac1 TaxID=2971616 RepID=UPI0021C67CF4|nr:glycosyltransferase [Pseudomonas sp. 5P_5.1_Bac1]MCU1724152.1 hypothetical protein [Pseudomonas sp. 5P_5.1_Bac1]